MPLAQALGPELSIPIGKDDEAVGIRHEHLDGAPTPQVQLTKEHGPDHAHVPRQRRRPAVLAHGAGTVQEGADIEPEECGREEANGGEHGEAPSDVGWDHAGRDSQSLRENEQVSLGGVGRRCPSGEGARTSRLLRPVEKHEQVGHGLGGAARLGDDVHGDSGRIERRKLGCHTFGIDIVEDDEPLLRPKGCVERKRPEGRAADAIHHQRVRLTRKTATLADGRGDHGLVVEHCVEAAAPRVEVPTEPLHGTGGLAARSADLLLREARGANAVRQAARVVEPDEPGRRRGGRRRLSFRHARQSSLGATPNTDSAVLCSRAASANRASFSARAMNE